jgi:hypothetical protein
LRATLLEQPWIHQRCPYWPVCEGEKDGGREGGKEGRGRKRGLGGREGPVGRGKGSSVAVIAEGQEGLREASSLERGERGKR